MAVVEWIDEFAAKHCTRFSWTDDRDLLMVQEWIPEFEKRGVTSSEADTASQRLMLRPPRYKADHLPELLAEVQAIRRTYRTPEPTMQVSITRCSLCGDSGRISGLPHWQRIDPERGWDGVTMAVACSCDRGQTFRQQRYLTLASYELNVPHWRELLAQREEERAARMARLEEARATR